MLFEGRTVSISSGSLTDDWGALEVHIYKFATTGPATEYTEKFQEWTATSADTWLEKDLTSYGVPGNAVVEIGLRNADPDYERWTGARAYGSSVDLSLSIDLSTP